VTRNVRPPHCGLGGGGAAALLVQLGLGQVVEGRLHNPVDLMVGGVVFAGTYVVLARRLHVREIDDLVGPVLERVRKSATRALSALG